MTDNLFSLDGRVALITGSSRGIGRAIAMTFAEAGAKVIVHGSRPGEKLERVAEDIRKSGGKAIAMAADLASAEETNALANACGSVDILVLNASVQSYQTIEDFAAEEFRRQYEVNVRSSFQLVQAMLPGMKENKWGRILAVGSVNQFKPSPRLSIYSSSKAALMNLMLNCAKQYSRYGITANNIAPGVILTGRNEDVLKDDNYRSKSLKLIPAGRFGTPDDCAALALLLCSDAGAYITGADIPVTGGMHL